MSKSSLKSTSNPDQPSSSHTRQASLNIARSPLLSPSTSTYVSGAPHTSPPKLGSNGRKASYVPLQGLERTSEEGAPMYPRKERSSDDVPVSSGRERLDLEDNDLHRDLEAFDLLMEPCQGRNRRERDGSANAGERDGDARYEGPFQPPEGKEMVGILASMVGVLVLAVAAGFTTVYDWVL